MSEDRRRPGQYVSMRDQALRSWLPEVDAYSPRWRGVFQRSSVVARQVRSVDDLRRLPVLGLADLGDGSDCVLEPDEESIAARGALEVRARLALARLTGRVDDFARTMVDVPYKPIEVTARGGADRRTWVAATTTDLERRAQLGRRALSISGVRADDVVVVVGPAIDGVTDQFLDGCREAGITTVPRCDIADLDALRPTVVVAGTATLRALSGALPVGVRCVVRALSSDEAPDPLDDDSVELPAGAATSTWWAPTPVRAAWATCPTGDGFHTWPVDELLEVHDDSGEAVAPGRSGRVVWSPVGWRGSIWFRVDLGFEGRLEADPCPACGRTTPRLVPGRLAPADDVDRWGSVVDQIPDVADWMVVRDGTTVVVLVEARERQLGRDVARAVTAGTGLRAIPVTGSRLRRALSLADGARSADLDVVAPALTRSASGSPT